MTTKVMKNLKKKMMMMMMMRRRRKNNHVHASLQRNEWQNSELSESACFDGVSWNQKKDHRLQFRCHTDDDEDTMIARSFYG